MRATISGETARSGICFKTNELLYVLSCVFICLNHEFYGVMFLIMAFLGTIIRFGTYQYEQKELELRQQQVLSGLDQVAHAHLVANRNKDAIH